MHRPCLLVLTLTLALAGCSGATAVSPDAGSSADVGRDAPADDAPATDAPPLDAPGPDAPPLDAPSPSDAGGDAGECNACVSAALAWRYDGGLACTRDSSTLSACRTFVHRRVAEACDPPDLECTNEIPACPTGAAVVTAADVNDALAHADVVAALAAAPVLYGMDPRAFDGQVFSVSVGGRTIEIGTCADASCSDIPAGVRALQALLEQLTMQQMDAAGCVEVFPGG